MTGRVRIPADVDQPDRILANLTGRQVAILAAAGSVLWAGYRLASPVLPDLALLIVAAPLAAGVAALVFGRRDGLSGDQFVAAAVRHALQPSRRVAAPEGVPALPPSLASAAGPPAAPLRLPVHGVHDNGLLDLGPAGAALLARASSINFILRSTAEQEALVVAFGRVLNALTAPLQIVVRAERVDLGAMAADVEAAAPGLAHPDLEAAARDHARFLRELSTRRDLLTREILLVFRDPAPAAAAGPMLERRAAEAAGLLRGAGITLEALDGARALAVLLRAVDPEAPAPSGRVALPGQPIRRRPR